MFIQWKALRSTYTSIVLLKKNVVGYTYLMDCLRETGFKLTFNYLFVPHSSFRSLSIVEHARLNSSLVLCILGRRSFIHWCHVCKKADRSYRSDKIKRIAVSQSPLSKRCLRGEFAVCLPTLTAWRDFGLGYSHRRIDEREQERKKKGNSKSSTCHDAKLSFEMHERPSPSPEASLGAVISIFEDRGAISPEPLVGTLSGGTAIGLEEPC